MGIAEYLAYARVLFTEYFPDLFASLEAFLLSPVPLAFLALGMLCLCINIIARFIK